MSGSLKGASRVGLVSAAIKSSIIFPRSDRSILYIYEALIRASVLHQTTTIDVSSVKYLLRDWHVRII